jgi:uncharacterized membrane protein
MTFLKGVYYNQKIILFMLVLSGFVLRYVNINSYSFWIDEVYTMFAIHPSISISEIISEQGAHQPPIFFIMCRIVCELFGFNGEILRFISIVFGSLSIYVFGLIGIELFRKQTAYLLALFVATNRMLIFYSLDARFYMIEFFFSSLSLLFFIKILKENNLKNSVMFIISMTMGAYFHHFGLIPPLIYFAIQCLSIYKKKNNKLNFKLFYKPLKPYFIFGILLIPWIFNGLFKGAKISTYWLKEIDYFGYVFNGFNYPLIINVLLIILLIVGFYVTIIKINTSVFPMIIIAVIALPLLYSIIKFPIMVPRYSIVMFPSIVVCIGFGFEKIQEFMGRLFINNFIFFVSWVILLLISIHSSFINTKWYEKQHWREAAIIIKSRSHEENKYTIYSPTSGVRNFAAIDFYLDYFHPKSKDIDMLKNKEKPPHFIFIEAISYYIIDLKVRRQINNEYNVKTYESGDGYSKILIHYCDLK